MMFIYPKFTGMYLDPHESLPSVNYQHNLETASRKIHGQTYTFYTMTDDPVSRQKKACLVTA